MPLSGQPPRVYSTNKDDYEIGEEIGQGMSAIVYKAVCKPFNEIVAIKSLDLEKCNSNLVSDLLQDRPPPKKNYKKKKKNKKIFG